MIIAEITSDKKLTDYLVRIATALTAIQELIEKMDKQTSKMTSLLTKLSGIQIHPKEFVMRCILGIHGIDGGAAQPLQGPLAGNRSQLGTVFMQIKGSNNKVKCLNMLKNINNPLLRKSLDPKDIIKPVVKNDKKKKKKENGKEKEFEEFQFKYLNYEKLVRNYYQNNLSLDGVRIGVFAKN